jgi:hypothetical protein
VLAVSSSQICSALADDLLATLGNTWQDDRLGERAQRRLEMKRHGWWMSV